MSYLWINMADLSAVGTIGPFGSPLNLMVRPELGDNRLGGCWYKGDIDNNYVVIKTTPERAEAIRGAIKMIGKQQIKRKVRSRVTTKAPGSPWKWVG